MKAIHNAAHPREPFPPLRSLIFRNSSPVFVELLQEYDRAEANAEVLQAAVAEQKAASEAQPVWRYVVAWFRGAVPSLLCLAVVASVLLLYQKELHLSEWVVDISGVPHITGILQVQRRVTVRHRIRGGVVSNSL